MKLQLLVLALFGIPSPFMLIIPGVDKKFDVKGQLTDATFQKNIDVFKQEFLWLANRLADIPIPA